MTEKELRKLSRMELLEMLIAQSSELQECKKKLDETENELKNVRIKIDRAGSIAEAALTLSGIFESADRACKIYTDNIRELSERQMSINAEMEAESRSKANQIISDAEKRRSEIELETKEKCDRMIRKAQIESDIYIKNADKRIKRLFESSPSLKKAVMDELGMPIKTYADES